MTESLRDPLTFVVGAVAAQVAGGLVTQLSPFMIAGFMDGLSLSERDAGSVTSVEFLALAVTAIVIAPFLPHRSFRQVGLAAAALALLAQGASLIGTSMTSLVLLRGLAGVGEGALYALSLSVVAHRSSNPDKIYGYFCIVWALGSVALFPLGGELTASFAHRGILALIAVVTLALSPLLLLIPDAHAKFADGAEPGAMRASPLLGVMTLAAIVLYLTASAAVYTFSEPLGERAGLDTSAVGYTLTVSMLVGFAGAATATALNVRWGRAIPISGFFAGSILATLALCLWRDPTVYVITLVAWGAIYYFSLPYLFGLAASLDRSGRWAAAAGSAYLFGFAAGPVVAGALIAGTGYVGLAVVCVAITVAALGLSLAVCQRLGQAAPVVLPTAALP